MANLLCNSSTSYLLTMHVIKKHVCCGRSQQDFYKPCSLLYVHPEVFVPLVKNNCTLAAHEVANPTSWLLPDYWIFDVPHLCKTFPFALRDALVKIQLLAIWAVLSPFLFLIVMKMSRNQLRL